MIYDLHSHTTASDGTLSPTELIQRAVNNKVDVLAITDHDTITGLPEANQYIKDNNLPIVLINGVEISSMWKNNEIHIVALNIDINNGELSNLLQKQKQCRIDRAIEIGRKLSKVGIEDAYQQAQVHAQGDIVSRSHFARFLIEKGYSKDMKRAFKKYLGKSGYAYVPAMWCSIPEAIEIIHKAGGQAVIAHPSRYDLTLTKLKQLFEFFKQSNGDGIEVSQSRQTLEDIKTLAKLALEFEFLASLGSDFHDLVGYLDLGKIQPLPASVKPIWFNWNKQ